MRLSARAKLPKKVTLQRKRTIKPPGRGHGSSSLHGQRRIAAGRHAMDREGRPNTIRLDGNRDDPYPFKLDAQQKHNRRASSRHPEGDLGGHLKGITNPSEFVEVCYDLKGQHYPTSFERVEVPARWCISFKGTIGVSAAQAITWTVPTAAQSAAVRRPRPEIRSARQTPPGPTPGLVVAQQNVMMDFRIYPLSDGLRRIELALPCNSFTTIAWIAGGLARSAGFLSSNSWLELF